MIDGIILAGGFSSRTKCNKMMLEYRGKAIIAHVIDSAHQLCETIYVVTGHHHKELSNLLTKYDFVKVIYNMNYSEGMFTSIKAGVQVTQNDFFIVPGDYPEIQSATYRDLLSADGDIRVPSFQHRLGHPIFFKSKLKDAILKTQNANLKEFRNNYGFTIVDVLDPGILNDIDDMNDYKDLLGKE